MIAMKHKKSLILNLLLFAAIVAVAVADYQDGCAEREAPAECGPCTPITIGGSMVIACDCHGR